MEQKRILAFGNPVFDIIMTPVVNRKDRVLSGCSTNACLAASKLGVPSFLVGTVGLDLHDRLEQELDHWGIGHQLYSSKQTGGFSLLYDESGNRELTVLGIADSIPVNADGVTDAGFILLGPILGEIPVELVKNIKEMTNAPILLDPQGLLRSVKDGQVRHELTDEFVAIARLSTVIKANELETQVVTGINPRKDPQAAAKALHDFGCQIAVVTLAEAGSIIYNGRDYYPIPPYVTHAIDPTGAGDTYAAGFMIRSLEASGDMNAIGCFASAVASIMVENSGPEFKLTRAEVDRRANSLLDNQLNLKL
jgi:sugar/nucleoside kinase (ribokinase family)